MKLKKFLILFLVLLSGNLYARHCNCSLHSVTATATITRCIFSENDYTLIGKINSLKKEYKDAVILLVDSLHKKMLKKMIKSNE